MVAFREPRARRSVACVLWTGNAAAASLYVLVGEVTGSPASPAFGLIAVALAVLAFVWRDQ
jgi:hypothetical protein